jgi:hypothetical protein
MAIWSGIESAVIGNPIDGAVRSPFALTYKELQDLPAGTRVAIWSAPAIGGSSLFPRFKLLTHYEGCFFVTSSLPASVRSSRLLDATGRPSISGGRAYIS